MNAPLRRRPEGPTKPLDTAPGLGDSEAPS